MIEYKCVVACPYKSTNYKVGDIDSFEEPMNPRVWVPLEGEPISFEDFVEYCRKKRSGELADDGGDEFKPYIVQRKGNRYQVLKCTEDSELQEVVESEMLKNDAKELVKKLTKELTESDED